MKISKFGISIHYIYLENCDVFVLPITIVLLNSFHVFLKF